MTASEIRANARKALDGKWGKGVLLTLVFFIIEFAITFILNLIPVVGAIASVIISMPMSYGLLACLMKLKRGEEFGYTDFLSLGFSSFGKVWAVFGNMILKMILPVALLIVFIFVFVFGTAGSFTASMFSSSVAISSFSGMAIIGFIGYIASLIYVVVKGYLYSLSYYILYDNENMTGKEIVEESARLMNGNRWKFFWLGLSFIGWAILSIFTLYIGYLWLFPYMMVALVCFYDALKGNNSTVETTKVEENPINTAE